MTDEADDTRGLDQLLSHLDTVTLAGREATALRQVKGPRIPRQIDLEPPGWQPPPSREDVRKKITGQCSRRFNRTVKAAGEPFTKTFDIGFLRPKVLNEWVADRTMQPSRNKSDLNHKAPPRFDIQSRKFEEPNDMQLHPMHREWLQQHRTTRDKHIHEVYYALKKVDACEEKAKEIQRQREKTRDMIGRPPLVKLDLPESGKAVLRKAQMAVKVARAFNETQGIDNLRDEEARHQEATVRAQSAPCLALKPASPKNRVRHLRNWTGPDRRFKWTQTDRCLRHTTPWMAQEEEHELKTWPIPPARRTASR